MMKKLNTGFAFLVLLFLFSKVSAQVPNSSKEYVFNPDSAPRQELYITASAGFGELPLLESHIDDAIYYNNIHSLRQSPLFSCSIEYLITSELLIGLNANYQTIPFSSLNIIQPFYYGNISAPYTFNTTPEFGFSLDYLQSDNTSIGIVSSYQSMQFASAGQQTLYPIGIHFTDFDIGLRTLYYFEGRNSNSLDFYIGGTLTLSVWKENDNWNNGVVNHQYIPIIISPSDSAAGITRPDNLQVSMLFYGGMRYFFAPAIGMLAEIGFGFGTPYYARCGLVIRLNHKH